MSKLDEGHLQSAIRLIWGRSVPDGIETNIDREVRRIANIRGQEEEAPPRAVMRKQVAKLASHTAALSRILADERTRRFVAGAAGAPLNFDEIAVHMTVLDTLIAAASREADALKKTKGPGIARRADVHVSMPALSRAKLECANLVVEAWYLARGRPPGKDTSDATDAAAHLWAAAGGKSLSKNEQGGGWAHWIKEVRRAEGDASHFPREPGYRERMRARIQPT